MSSDGSRPSLVVFQANSHEIRGWIWAKVDPSVTTVQWQRLPAISNQGLTDDWGNISDAYYDDKTGDIFFLLNYESDRLVIVSADDLIVNSTSNIVDLGWRTSRGSGIVRCGTSLLAFGWQELPGGRDGWNPPLRQIKLWSCKTDTSGGEIFNGSTWIQTRANIPWHLKDGRMLGDTRFPGLKHAFYFPDEHSFWMIQSQYFHQVPGDQNANIAWKQCGISNPNVDKSQQCDHPFYTTFITSYQPGGTGPIKYRLYVFGCGFFDARETGYGTCISLDETGYPENLIISTDGSPDYVKLPFYREPGHIVLPNDTLDTGNWCRMRACEYGSGGSWAISLQTTGFFRLFTLDVDTNTGYLINAKRHECKLDGYLTNCDSDPMMATMAAIPTPRRFKAIGGSREPDDEGDFDENDGE